MSFERSTHAATSAALASASASAPAMLGDYALLTKLATGGMATVYVGRKSAAAGFERLVAIKCCHPHLRDSEDFTSMFLDEARLAASIRHPNVVATLDVSDGELLYLVMEYVEGCSLANLLRHAARSKTPIPVGIALRVMIDTLQGLHAAHELRDAQGNFANLVHRDVSPQNILIGVDGVSRITDFGIAFASARSTHTNEGVIKGKFAYIAPEQITGHDITRRMDVFSAGSVLWEALTGRALFRRKDDAGTIHAVVTAVIPPPSSLVPGLPAELDKILARALARRPDARYQTAADFADALEQVAPAGISTRAVGKFVQRTFERELGERRELIRTAPERGIDALHEMPSRPSNASPSGSQPSDTGSPLAELSASDIIELPSAEDFEHRRMRGLIAAGMLLLVGSALGLLLARSSGGAQAAPAPSATGAAAASSLPERNPQP